MKKNKCGDCRYYRINQNLCDEESSKVRETKIGTGPHTVGNCIRKEGLFSVRRNHVICKYFKK